MAVKKLGATSGASADTVSPPTTTSPSDEVTAIQSNGNNSDNVSVDTVAEGQHEVSLLDFGISAKDIAALRRVDARLEEVRKTQQAALEAGTSEPQMVTRAKGKEVMLSEAQKQEQYNRLKEEELRCLAMQQKFGSSGKR